MKKQYFTLILLVFGFLVSAQTTEGDIVNETTAIKKISGDAPIITKTDKTLLSAVMSATTALTGNSAEVGITEGELSISLNGNASYTIPITIPKGINNVEPQISVVYNSQNGLNGTAARGWDISGVSSITRIPSTKFHDGVIDPVDFNALDRFALDGQRLIVKTGTTGVYGANNTVYETEYFSNIKVTSYGVSHFGSNYGPAYFYVEYPDGSKAFYGSSINSSSIMEWSVLYFENAQGLRINYLYTLLNNTLYIDSIKYGSVNSYTAPNEIKFSYEERIFPENGYVAGQNIIRSKRLKEIKVITSGIGYRNYSLSYMESDRINKITETSGDGTKSYNPTVFDYGMTPEAIKYQNIVTSLDLGNIESLNVGAVSGDFDSDGKMDCLVYPTIGADAKTKYWLYAGIESGNYVNFGREHNVGAFDDIFTATFLSSDNKILPQGWVIAKKTNTQFTFTIYGMIYTLGSNNIQKHYERVVNIPKTLFLKNIIAGDFNGDGLTDVLAVDSFSTIIDYPAGKQVYFIDLKRDKTTDFSTFAGELQTVLSKTSKVEVADFNGDGKSDLFVYDAGILTIYSLNRDNKLIVLYKSAFDHTLIAPSEYPYLTTNMPILIGDYNGDGKSDFMIPKAYGSSQWYKYTSTGTTMIKEEKTYTAIFSRNDSYNTYNYIATDFNNDGKTDLIKVWNEVKNNNGNIIISCYESINGDFVNPEHRAATGPKPEINIYALPVFLPQSLNNSNSILNKINSTLDIAFFNQNKIHFFNSGGDYKKSNLLTNITTGNGVQEAITYIPLDSQFANTYQNTTIYKSSKGIASYPDFDILTDPNLYVVSKLEKQSKDDYKKRLFAYYGAVSNTEGLGFMGFRSVTQTDWYNDTTATFSNITKNDINLRGAAIENYFIRGFREPLVSSLDSKTPSSIIKGGITDYIVSGTDNLLATESITLKPDTWIKPGSTFSAKINEGANNSPNTPVDFITKSISTYESNLLSNKVFKLKNTINKQFNTLTNTNSEAYIEYDAYNNPLTTTAILKEGFSTVQTTVENTEYYNNIATSPYVIGRPERNTQSVSVSGDIMRSKQIYYYDHVTGLVNQFMRQGHNTNFIIELNNYDNFGNLVNKSILAPGVAIRKSSYEYDPSGRFLTKVTDHENLSTSFVYNVNGTLKSQTNPYNLTTSFTYDSWFKKRTITDEKLNKTITHVYTRNAEKAIVSTTTDALDGSATEETFDDLGRKIKSGQKDLNGKYAYVSFMYDVFDRNYKTSEPYFDAGPSQWNETKFDIYSRPDEIILFNTRTTKALYNGLTSTIVDGQKIKSVTKNAIGNIISSNENTGGTIKYNYFANGNLKQTDYNGVKIDIEQDGWGRKTKITDPSAGVFTYKNNDLGELETETSKNGEVVTTITRDKGGKPIKKTVTGSGTDTETIYEYDATTQLLNKTTFNDKKEPVGNNQIVTTYTYDDIFKRVLKIVEDKTGVSKFTTIWSYDGLGRIDTETKEAELGSRKIGMTTQRRYKNGNLYQILENNTKKVLWQINDVNAKGQLKESILGNGIKTTNEYDSNGYVSKIQVDKTTGQTGNVLTLNTKFDFKTDNLENRTNSAFNNYTESFKYDELDRLTEFTNKDGIKEIQNYEASGKIKDNNLGTYNYSKEKPYQNTAITLTPEAYGYYVDREGAFKDGTTERKLDITYNAFKSPLQITESTIDKISFSYNDNNQRSTMYYGSMEDEVLRPLRKHYSADGTMEIKQNIKTGSTEFVVFVGGDGYTAPIVAMNDGTYTTPNISYLHRDYQGTILAITDASAVVMEKRLFDAWGALIKVEDKAGNILKGLTFLDRGYTGHEHLQSVGLINMNARLYDPVLHRFLQIDNFIQDPTNTQNYNQYGYVLNNPLLYTDPSGNAYNDGKDCKGCGPTEGQQIGAGGLIGTVVNNWDDWGIKDWANKNINLKKIDQWRKDKISLNNIFGRHKNSGPPPNMSKYANLNNASFTGAKLGSSISKVYNSNKQVFRSHFDAAEISGGTAEIIGLLGAPFTEGASLEFSAYGAKMSAYGTVGNSVMDIFDGEFSTAANRWTQFVISAGMGKAIESGIPQSTLRNMLSSFKIYVETYVAPVFEESWNKFNVSSNKLKL
ncbi:FG-GAP-like repeat-containing protein [Flavobacterium sp. N1736]|uniref:FG-GAP-like repeat-containing protein n=1 Tax=Flavobacterium sp. N1736 TaxID=2986823 RepID=UPI0022250A8C|nr:FG-GAP-like repeat-containing protein [Flavobacterium sp. N1736]